MSISAFGVDHGYISKFVPPTPPKPTPPGNMMQSLGGGSPSTSPSSMSQTLGSGLSSQKPNKGAIGSAMSGLNSNKLTQTPGNILSKPSAGGSISSGGGTPSIPQSQSPRLGGTGGFRPRNPQPVPQQNAGGIWNTIGAASRMASTPKTGTGGAFNAAQPQRKHPGFGGSGAR